MKQLIIDIETDGLLLEAKNIWVVVCKFVGANDAVTFTDPTGLQELLDSADKVIGHNLVMFDLPVLRRLWNIQYDVAKCFDTLLVSRLLLPDREGGHGLKEWGARLHKPKIEFNDWSKYSKEMEEYCVQDVSVCEEVYKRLVQDLTEYPKVSKALSIEHQFAYLIRSQIQAGFKLDTSLVEELYQTLKDERVSIELTLLSRLPKQKVLAHYKTIKDKGQLLHECEQSYTYQMKNGKMVTKEFEYLDTNLNSRQQIAKFLKSKGWIPKEFTETGLPKIDEKVLGSLPYEEAKLLARAFRLTKQMGMLKDGDAGWLKMVNTETKRVHGSVLTNATNTGRCSHCVPMNSLALTKTGWKGYSDLNIGDEILGYDIKTNTKKWTKILNLNYFQDMEVGNIGNGNVKLKCTANHKWVVYAKQRNKEVFKLKEARELRKYDAILVNAPYENLNSELQYMLPIAKYNYPHIEDVLRFNKQQLHCFMLGFLLADGHLKKSTNGTRDSWSFSQAEGDILDTVHTAMYLYSHTRISKTCKTRCKKDTQRFGYNVTQTQVGHLRSSEGMQWTYTGREDVWCPTTELETWIMKQGDVITITGNSKPNVAQCDRKDIRMRQCWVAEEGNLLVGCDASGLELRLLGHYLFPYDKGTFAFEVIQGDIHTYNQEAMHLNKRDSAKGAIYALVYGAGNKKLGILDYLDKELKELDEIKLAKAGKRIRSAVEDNITGYKELVKKVGDAFKVRGYLLGIDGRPLHPRSDYSALNLLIQNAGAIVMKEALIQAYKKLTEEGLELEKDYKFVANIHDEIIVECRVDLAESIGKTVKQAIVDSGVSLGIHTKLDGEYKIGKSWGETH